MCRLILTAGLCLIIASLARTTSAGCTSTSTNGCASGFCTGRTNGNYINTANPNTFYMCSNQLTYLTNCQAGLVYRAPCDCCDYPTSPCYTSPTGSPATPSPDMYCKDKASGLYCYPPDHTKFYQCSNGLTYIMTCPGSTVFSSSANVCVGLTNA